MISRASSPTMAILLARFSPRPDAKTSESNDAQLEACRAHCIRKGYTIAAELQDDATSGDDFDRPGLQAAIAALKKGWVLVVDHPDRLARKVLHAEIIREGIKKKGARVESVHAHTEDDPMGNLIRQILAAVAEYQKVSNAALTSIRSRRHQSTGRRMCSPDHLPYGWQLDPHGPQIVGRDEVSRPARMIPNESELAICGRVLELAGQGMGSMKIKRRLEADGIRCRGRESWNRKTIEAIIRRGASHGTT